MVGSARPMGFRALAGALLIGALVRGATAVYGATAGAAPPQGVRVEAIGASSSLTRSELRAGDVIVSWARLASTPKGTSAQGPVTSPLEILALEREGRPVSFTAARGEEVVFVHAPPGPWLLALSPILPVPQARELERARTLSRGGSHEEAGSLLRRIAGSSAASRRFLLGAWLELEACRSFREAGDLESLRRSAERARDWARRSRQVREEALLLDELENLVGAR